MVAGQAEALSKRQPFVIAEEAVNEIRGVERGFVIDFLLHISDGDDLYLRTRGFDDFKHIRKLLLDVLVLVDNQHVIRRKRRFCLDKGMDQI